MNGKSKGIKLLTQLAVLVFLLAAWANFVSGEEPTASANGEVYSIGSNYSGQLGLGYVGGIVDMPTLIEGLTGVKNVSAGSEHTLVLMENGDVYSFGKNDAYYLGPRPGAYNHTPAKIVGFPGPAKAVAAGKQHSLVLLENGDVYSFGYNVSGQLGHGNTDRNSTPTKIEALSGEEVIAISAGAAHSLVLTADGEVYSFGANGSGRLGLGNEGGFVTTPTKIPDFYGVDAIAAGGTHSLALTVSGAVYSFGDGGVGRLGHGDTSDVYTPKVIEALSGVEAIAAGSAHSLATVSGAVYSFGFGTYGRLGHGDTGNVYVPTKIADLNGVKNIAGGGQHTLVLLDSGEVYSFGRNEKGQLGQGDNVDRLTPEMINGINDVTAISAGGDHSLLVMGSAIATPTPDAGNSTVSASTNPESPEVSQNFTFTVQVRDAENIALGGLDGDFTILEDGDGTLTVVDIVEEGIIGNYTVTASHDTAETINITVTAMGVDIGGITGIEVREPAASSSAKDITAFSFTAAANTALDQDVTAVIDESAITATVPHGTDIAALKATFTLSSGASVYVGDTLQESGVTANDFTGPVTYTVNAEDNSTKSYTVTVTETAAPRPPTGGGGSGSLSLPKDEVPPYWPGGGRLTSEVVSETSLLLKWTRADDNEGVTGYWILKDDNLVDKTGGGSLSRTIKNLARDNTYTFTVMAVDAAGNTSDPNPSVTMTTGTILKSIVIEPGQAIGGLQCRGRVTLSLPAGKSDVSVQLKADNE